MKGLESMFVYPVTLRKDGDFVLATFCDIPEAITQGADIPSALRAAKDALETAMDFYFEQRRAVPEPSKLKRGQPGVGLPFSVSVKVMLLNEMIRQGVRPAELARRLHTTPQVVNRLTNVRHPTKIDTLAEAMKALGQSLEVRVVRQTPPAARQKSKTAA